tara:strand:- start:1289 stop:2203 length:915 start_codon:yes stop_codon:yes gene_type:complete
MSEITRKLAIFSCFLFTSFCFWKVGTGLIGDADTEILPSAHAAMSPSITPSLVKTTPIQQMRPGMRVVGRNPLRLETEATIDPTPEGWRLVSVQMRKEDGTYFEAELLRPLSWIYRHHAQPGAVIQLNMPELHVVGAAEVLSISDCPPIDPGDGPVVISTFKNVSHNVLNIYVEGETEPIGVAAGHPIWSEDRQILCIRTSCNPANDCVRRWVRQSVSPPSKSAPDRNRFTTWKLPANTSTTSLAPACWSITQAPVTSSLAGITIRVISASSMAPLMTSQIRSAPPSERLTCCQAVALLVSLIQ